MSHTPGPWKEIPQNGAGPMIAHEFETGKQMNPVGLRLICHVLQRGNSLEQDRANARLLAAAPDLLEALVALLTMSDRGPQPRKLDEALSWRDNDDRARALTLAAIEKATGAPYISNGEVK